ncbi:hypothetical protein ENSA5_47380 [Enhygromyxa salina]|uniref:Uncharacterized protein n=1 Tax=Enhygromyxa salina TaxID=215803 RepID=A0A2S9XIX2_9BACT|nr:MYXO-CTERM sorting domain-containing protein [Enhygromyxa salina]PRP92825.1 hypothetical protein ENSA5_47380 [Enhygromyxa salina]
MSRPTLFLLALLPTLAACSHWGEADYLGFGFPDFVDDLVDFESGDLILRGSPLCPEIEFRRDDDGTQRYLSGDEREALRACFDESISGPAQLDDGGCIHFDGPGEVVWELTPDSCGDQTERMRFTVVEPDPAAQLGFDEWRLRLVQESVVEGEVLGLAPGRSVEELQESPGAARRVFAGQLDAPLLRLDDSGGRVFWMNSDVSLELVGEGVEAVAPIPSDDPELNEWVMLGEQPLTLAPGSSGRVRATLASGEVYESPELIAVGLTEAASLDLVVADTYAFADVRDAEGRLIHGAPIEWSVVEGALAITPGSLVWELRTGEYATLHDGNCEPAPAEPELRRAVVRARLGALEDTIEYEYLVEPIEEPDFGSLPEPDEDCMYGEAPETPETPEEQDEPAEGCGCSSEGGGSPLAPLAFGLGVLALLRRRA